MPYFVRLVIEGLETHTLTAGQLWKLIALFAATGTIGIFFSRLIRYIPLRLSHRIEYTLRNDLFEHLTRLDQSFYRTERTGDLMTKLSSDMNIIRDSIGQGLLQGTRTLITMVSASIVMFIADPRLTGLMFSVFIPMTIIFFLVLKLVRRYQQAMQEHVSEVSNFCHESFSGIRCIKGFAMERRRTGQFEELNHELIRKTMRMQASRQSLWPFMAFCFNLGTILIFISGGRRIIDGTLTIGTLTQFTYYLFYMRWPLLALSWVMSMLQRGKVSWIRVRDILETEPAIAEREESISDPSKPNASIAFRKVSLSIGPRELLSDIDLEIPAGTTIGITGPTGSGKTLLTSLVARLQDPTSGTVEIGGIDIRNLSLATLRGMIGFAAQEPVLFSRTLEHNIGFGVENPDMGIIGWAAEIAHLQGDIETFPDRYQTILGERGVTLSGGQRQRTSISRAIARRPDILILDDVLSAVDTQTEAAIMKKLQPVMAERTTLFVSHRVSTLRYSDTIVVIENGRITQQGTHDELIRQPGYYAELNTMQQLQEKLEGGK
ncbi:MAG: ABC transporter ATP-binding protein [Pontiellaceae bacterium]|nr:ABC transporter ATP-binding protein [Pontiellaceae bacterium]MBN2785981.1 ABC transporter ATP-binding protein [Pontiellaceae bacterium]